MKIFFRFDALSHGVYPLSDERLPEVFESNKLSCEVDVNVSLFVWWIHVWICFYFIRLYENYKKIWVK